MKRHCHRVTNALPLETMEAGETKTWRITTKFGGGWQIGWRPGYALPSKFTATVDGEDLPYLVELDLVASDEEVHCTAVRFVAREDGEPITARRLRDTRLGECVHSALASALRPVIEKPGSIVIPLAGGLVDVTKEFEIGRPDAARRKWVLTPEHLREVARVYLEAEGKKPTETVQNNPRWAPQTHSTAARWVHEARRRDDPATGRKFLAPVATRQSGPQLSG